MRALKVSERDCGRSVKDILKKHSQSLSSSYLNHKFSQGAVILNGRSVKGGEVTVSGDEIRLYFKLDKPVIFKSRIPLDILYEDEYLLALNKPPNLAVHPGCGNYSDTLLNRLMNHFNIDEYQLNSKEKLPFGFIGRLDKETSGVILVSKDPSVQYYFQKEAERGRVDKTYIALVEGRPKKSTREISIPLKRDPNNRMRMIASEAGKEARTTYRVIENFGDYALISIKIETGRTHQIRAHMSLIGCPLAGDIIYGGIRNKDLFMDRVMLHSESISFTHPLTSEKMEVSALLAGDIIQTLGIIKEGTEDV